MKTQRLQVQGSNMTVCMRHMAVVSLEVEF